MQKQKSWPDRYSVTFRSAENYSQMYSVCTWLSSEKAVALATTEHLRLGHQAIYSVEIELLGPAAREDSGVVKLLAGDLIDRIEW